MVGGRGYMETIGQGACKVRLKYDLHVGLRISYSGAVLPENLSTINISNKALPRRTLQRESNHKGYGTRLLIAALRCRQVPSLCMEIRLLGLERKLTLD